MSAQPQLRYTMEEYLELDRNSDERLEYWNGEIFSMSGVSREHGQIETNLAVHLGARLISKGCYLYPANIRIKVPSLPPYRYGDMSALCGAPVFEKIGGVDALTNPALIVEVLSSSTEAFDRGDKFTHYKSIPSFREYLLIAQHRPHITQLVKQDDGSWTHREFNGLDEIVKLVHLGCEMSLREIYQMVLLPVAPVVPPIER